MAEIITHVVKSGETLWAIAGKYMDQLGKDRQTLINEIVKQNSIPNKDLIYVGQKLTINSPLTAQYYPKNFAANVYIFGLQSKEDMANNRTVIAAWGWTVKNTENYEVEWYYDTGDGIWFTGNKSTTEDKNSVYNAPENAKQVKFIVTPIAKKRKVNGKDTPYWDAKASTAKIYDFDNNLPAAPSDVKVSVDKLKLKVEASNVPNNVTEIQFEVWKITPDTNPREESPCLRNKVSVSETGYATYTFNVETGYLYKARAKAFKSKLESAWSDFTEEVETQIAASSGITVCKATKAEDDNGAVYLEWGAVKAASSYTIEYTTKKEYFDTSNEVQSISNAAHNQYTITQLKTGLTYYFRVRANHLTSLISSEWTEIVSVVVGTKPAPPTTWSNNVAVCIGDPLTLYWIHNSEDNSNQTRAFIELYIGGAKEEVNIDNDKGTGEGIQSYVINTSAFSDDTVILWRVKTAGVTGELCDEWSEQRKVTIYARPTVTLNVTNKAGFEVNALNPMVAFPLYISAVPGLEGTENYDPEKAEQAPLSYNVTISAVNAYETTDSAGNRLTIKEGGVVYSKNVDITNELRMEISANHVSLENNVTYLLKVTMAMDSGLKAEAATEFTTEWTDLVYDPTATVYYEADSTSIHIMPYCEDENGTLLEDIVLSVYRHNYDDTFTEIYTELPNDKMTYVVDPHPSLDVARYRVLAKNTQTSEVSYSDIPGYEIGETSAIIQWNEQWSPYYKNGTEDALAQPSWGGSLLKLPYNIDVTYNTNPDTVMVEYIGRSHPVGYYGTHVGETQTWNVVVPRSDGETLYALHRLSKWMGNVYVREPSGTGFYASVTVSFGTKHKDVSVPVTIEVVRVEGGA